MSHGRSFCASTSHILTYLSMGAHVEEIQYNVLWRKCMCKDLATLKLSTHEAMQCGLVALLVNVRFEGIVLTRSTRRSSVQFSSLVAGGRK